jgi:hypothetical protein
MMTAVSGRADAGAGFRALASLVWISLRRSRACSKKSGFLMPGTEEPPTLMRARSLREFCFLFFGRRARGGKILRRPDDSGLL